MENEEMNLIPNAEPVVETTVEPTVEVQADITGYYFSEYGVIANSEEEAKKLYEEKNK